MRAPDELLDEDQTLIADAIRELCTGFDDDYWARCDREHEFPWDFYARLAEGGWLGLAIPEEYGGGGRGISDAAVMLHEIAASGAAMNGCSAVHLTVFGLNPVVKFGNDRLKETFLPRAAAGELHVAFGVTEPDAGTDTGRISTRAEPDGRGGWRIHGRKIWTTKALESEVVLLIARTGDKDSGLRGLSLFLADLDRDYVDIRAIPKVGRNAVASCEVAYDGLPVESWRLLGEENNGFRLLLHGLNPERVLLASEACGIGEVALDRAVTYAKDRIVFDRPIGANQAISHPLAHAHAQLRGGVDDGAARGAPLRRRPGVRRGREHREVPRRRGLVPRRRPSRADPRRHGIRLGVPRGAILAGGTPATHRAGDPGDDAELPGAECAGPAPQLLTVQRVQGGR